MMLRLVKGIETISFNLLLCPTLVDDANAHRAVLVDNMLEAEESNESRGQHVYWAFRLAISGMYLADVFQPGQHLPQRLQSWVLR